MKNKECKNHNWVQVSDHCFDCGAYSEICENTPCMAERYLSGGGKEQEIHENK